jgi:hypothetical protein
MPPVEQLAKCMVPSLKVPPSTKASSCFDQEVENLFDGGGAVEVMRHSSATFRQLNAPALGLAFVLIQ